MNSTKLRYKKKYLHFNYKDVCKATGLSMSALKARVQKKCFDPYDLVSLAKFIIHCQLRQDLRTKQEKGV